MTKPPITKWFDRWWNVYGRHNYTNRHLVTERAYRAGVAKGRQFEQDIQRTRQDD